MSINKEIQSQIKSIEQEIKESTDLAKLSLYDKFLDLWAKQDLLKAIELTKEYQKTAIKVNNWRHRIKAGIRKYVYLTRLGKKEEALLGYQALLPIAIEHNITDSISAIYANMSLINTTIDKEISIKLLYQALEYSRKYNHKELIIIQLINLGQLHRHLRIVTEETAGYYLEAIKIAEETKDWAKVALAQAYLAGVYKRLDRPESQRAALFEGLAIATRIMDIEVLAWVKNSLVDFHYHQKEYEEAIVLANELIPIFQDTHQNQLAFVYKRKGDCHFELGQLTKAKESLLKAKNIVQKEPSQIIFINEILEKIAEKEGEIETAYALLKERTNLFQEQNTTEKNETILKMQTEFDSVRKDKENVELKLKALRSQMNPHFIFNSLNAIQSYVSQNNNIEAIKYIAEFARLMRQILQGSEQVAIPLIEQIDFIKNYLRLESLRFNERFIYQIEIDEEIEEDMMNVPPMIVQPYVENAIIHGMKGKKEGGLISIKYTLMEDDKHILCVVEDNGTGRQIKPSKEKKGHKSLGTKITEERLKAINQDASISVEFIDLKDEKNNPLGTQVKIILPIMN